MGGNRCQKHMLNNLFGVELCIFVMFSASLCMDQDLQSLCLRNRNHRNAEVAAGIYLQAIKPGYSSGGQDNRDADNQFCKYYELDEGLAVVRHGIYEIPKGLNLCKGSAPKVG